ncbi:MAG: ErfK/YbiS/YcfS/YnhG family protein [Verrucomicrobiales bacterium]|nr:ErfK/YbiS/YcfS/YnhG family protein [Verrucomicrobiales bacterium]
MKAFLLALLVAVLGSSCADTRHRMIVSVAEQRMVVLDEGKMIGQFPVSTSKFGVGVAPDGVKYFTPLGRHAVAKKIGGGQPLGMKFKSRKATGEIVPVNAPGRDPIVTRILWLKGLEAQNKSTFGRYIYIHGTPEEAKLGKPASYGCVRMRSVDVAWLYDIVGKGARVDILLGPVSSAAP